MARRPRPGILLALVALAGCGSSDRATPPPAVLVGADLRTVLEAPLEDAPGNPSVRFLRSPEVLQAITDSTASMRPALALVGFGTFSSFNEDEMVRPRIVATDRLVLVARAGAPLPEGARALAALRGVVVAQGPSDVAAATRQLRSSAGEDGSFRGLANGLVESASSADDVVERVRAGGAPYGFTFQSAARRAGAAIRTMELPALLETDWLLQVAVAPQAREAGSELEKWLLDGGGRAALRRAGYDPPPPV